MVLRLDNMPALAYVTVILILGCTASGHLIPRNEPDPETIPETYNDAVAFAATTSETGWMVTAIIFIVLFALSIIVCIYLWYLRNEKMKELRHIKNVVASANKDNQNVWYGGGAYM